MTLRIGTEVHQRLEIIAEVNCTSITAQIAEALRSHLEQYDRHGRKLAPPR